MKRNSVRLVAALLAIGAVAVPAFAAETMRHGEARVVARTAAKDYLGVLLSRKGEATIRVEGCDVANGRAACWVRANGDLRCRAHLQLRENETAYRIWADRIRCR